MCKEKNPCWQCTDRNMTCHSECPLYAEYRAEKDAEIARRDAIRAGSYSLHERLRVNHKLIDKSKKGAVAGAK